METNIVNGVFCMNKKCKQKFLPTEISFLYCCDSCSRSRPATDERKIKVITTLNKLHNNLDKNNVPISDPEESKLNKRNKCIIRDQIRYKNNKVPCLTKIKEPTKPKETKKRYTPDGKEYFVYTYETIIKFFEMQSCTLILSKEEYEKDTTLRKFNIIASCGHIRQNFVFRPSCVIYTNFLCIACIKEQTVIQAAKNIKQNGIITTMMIENVGYNKIKQLIIHIFDVVRTRECCRADILIKPKNINNDKWLPIQLKITQKTISAGYHFNIGNDYKNMYMLLYCINDDILWLTNDSLGKAITSGKFKSKYDKYRLDNDKLCEKMLSIYNNVGEQLISLDTGNTPISITAQIEYQFVKLREKHIKFIKFEHTEIDGLVYDFKVDNKKVQEKVSSSKKIHLLKRFGSASAQIRVPYAQNDNDYYWLNINNTHTFYVIPEIILINHGYICTSMQPGKMVFCASNKKSWLKDYTFDYLTINDEINKQMLLKVLNLIK